MRYEQHNLDGRGAKRVQVYDLPPVSADDYWSAVTDVPCPVPTCEGVLRWAEAGYSPGYRICDQCKRHYIAKGNAEAPKVLRVGSRRG